MTKGFSFKYKYVVLYMQPGAYIILLPKPIRKIHGLISASATSSNTLERIIAITAIRCRICCRGWSTQIIYWNVNKIRWSTRGDRCTRGWSRWRESTSPKIKQVRRSQIFSRGYYTGSSQYVSADSDVKWEERSAFSGCRWAQVGQRTCAIEWKESRRSGYWRP